MLLPHCASASSFESVGEEEAEGEGGDKVRRRANQTDLWSCRLSFLFSLPRLYTQRQKHRDQSAWVRKRVVSIVSSTSS